LGTYLEYTDANLGLSTAKLTYLNAVHEHVSAQARLDFSTGRTRVPGRNRKNP
jgi:hypothetical protein